MNNEKSLGGEQAQTPLTPPKQNNITNATMNQNKEVGSIISIIIIIIIFVLGGLYVWGARLNKAEQTKGEVGLSGQSAQDISQAQDPALDNLKTQGTSDNLSAIEDDLDTTSLNGLDTGINDINIELQ